jgi:ATP-binding cassette subfamily B multidrug efflux pump
VAPPVADVVDSAAPSAPEVSNRELLRWMFRFLKPVKWLALACALLLMANIALEVATVNLSGVAITRVQLVSASPTAQSLGLRQWLVSDDPSIAALRRTILFWTLFVAAAAVLRYLRETTTSRFSMDGVYYIREAVYDKLQRVGLGFHDAISSGQLINRALSDLQNVRNFVQNSLMLLLDILLGVPAYIVLMGTKSPWLALLSLVPLPIWTVYIYRFSRRVQPAAKAALETEDRNVSLITENIAGVHVVKAFATERAEVQKYDANADEFQKRVLKRIRLFANFHPVIRGIASASHLSLFLIASIILITQRGSDHRTLAVGDLVVLGGAMTMILMRLQNVSTINEQYQNAIVSARRLYEVLGANETVPEADKAPALPNAGGGEVTFEHVSFGYGPTGKNVLHDVSFTAKAGSVVAIVGPTGSGKTTLVNLIARFYDPREGRVLIDGRDVRDISLSSLRTQVSFVFQETYLFSDTVRANVAYGRPGISPGDVEAATRLAQAHEFIEAMPKGYDTMLGERGTNLSGGQRQRLAIARAIVTNPRILILDDATAAVDSETEDLIRRGMRFVMAGRTTFVIAHRISTVKRADLVLVLEHGRITQQGTHEELLNASGHYREVAMAQLSPDEMMPRRRATEEDPSHVKRMRDEKQVAAAAAKAANTPAAAASVDRDV